MPRVSFAERASVCLPGESEASVGARYALAAWDKLPLNPALSATWHFGTGSDLANRLEPARRGTTADSYELRLLVGQEFIPRLFWTANVFFQHDAASGHERQAGFAQDVSYLVLADRLTVGAEMRYTNATRRGSNRGSANEFLIGPSINLRSDFHSLFGLAALFGCTGDSPQVAILASVSFEFGGGESRKSKSPIANP